jgi:probable F420-dependent oxidoreductase
MRLGYILPHIGSAASAEAIVRVAQRAEALGYESLWVTDRTMFPARPRESYAGGPLPEPYRISLDPLQTLAFAAAHTSTIRLGTSVLVMGNYNPLMLARSLTALDVLSGGRLLVGLGQGWSSDEHEAVGVSMRDRGARADEFIRVLKMIWTQDVIEHAGTYFTIAKTTIEPKPVQDPHPPIYLAAYAPGSMKRLATHADGWNPGGLVDPAMWTGIRDMAAEAGRDPDALKIVVRANINITDAPVDNASRWPFIGSREQVKSDLESVRASGADEIFFDPTFSPAGTREDTFLESLETMWSLANA